jgi:hypothetical protein
MYCRMFNIPDTYGSVKIFCFNLTGVYVCVNELDYHKFLVL